MALQGELSGLNGAECIDCGLDLKLEVLHSVQGYYLGYFCPEDGPHSRETEFYASREGAESELKWWREEGQTPILRGSMGGHPHKLEVQNKLEVQTFESANKMLAHLIPPDQPQIGPIIPTIAGLAIVNPGTGPCPGATEINAATNIVQLIEDAGLDPDEIVVTRCPEQDDEGRFYFILKHNEYTSEVDMPGWPIEKVRYLGQEDQNIWDFPRLYVDGSSWVWKYAVSCMRDELTGENEEEDEDA